MNSTTPPLPDLSPTAPAERIEAMDALRGVALLGILLMNIEAFVGPLLLSQSGLDPALRGADRVVDALVYILVQGKFYLIFSLLFGMGFTVMERRAGAVGRGFVAPYLRRTCVLLVIGLGHGLLIWSGDILVTYALIAIPLLLLTRVVPPRHLPYWGVGLYAAIVLMVFGFGAIGSLAQIEPTIAAEMRKALDAQGAELQAMLEAQRRAYGGNDYWAAVAQRGADTAFNLSMLVVLGGVILGMFLIGAWFAHRGAIARPQDFPRLYARLRLIAMPVGLGLMLLSFALEPTVAFDRLDLASGTALALAMFGGLLMSLGYVAWIVRGLDSAVAPLLRWVAPAGRMALTNYLGQSVICSLIFYGYGLGYFEQLPRAWQPLFVLAIFVAQVLFSRWWLARFRFGPVEWLWRAATYLRLPAMSRTAASVA